MNYKKEGIDCDVAIYVFFCSGVVQIEDMLILHIVMRNIISELRKLLVLLQ
jgi:hypothetical protein